VAHGWDCAAAAGGGGGMAMITLQPLRREGVHGLMCVKLHGCPVSRATPAAL
jgi:hypothetical protein